MKFYSVYFDACAINRLTDDQKQDRIWAEARAVEEILRYVLLGRVFWSGSRALEVELQANRNLEKRENSLELLSHARPLAVATVSVRGRAMALGIAGYGPFDALHLAHAEDASADALLTTDDRFIRLAARGVGSPGVQVLNPVDWLREVQPWLQTK